MSQTLFRFIPRALACACAAALFSMPVSANEAAVPEKDSVSQSNAHVLTRDILAKVLTAELAIQRNNETRGFNEYYEIAQATGYAELARRAVETAENAQNEEQAQKAVALWNKLDPDNERIRFERAGKLMQEGNFEEAKRLAKDLLKEAEDPNPMLESLAGLGATVEAKSRFYETFAELAKPYEENSGVQLLLAAAAAQAKMGEKARDHGIRAIELTPDNPHVLIQGADYEFAIDPKAASKRLENYLKDHPNSHQVRLSYAKSLLRVNDPDKLEKELARIDSAMKDNPRILMIIGMIAEEGGLLNKAELYYKKYLVQIAKNPTKGLSADAAYVRLGMVKLNQGHKELAIDWLDKVQAGEQYQAARLKEAELLANSNRIDEACKVLKEIRTDDAKQKAGFRRSCGQLLLQQGRKNEAVDVLIEAIDLMPEDAELLYQTALLAEEADRMNDSEKLLRRFIEKNPENPNGYNSLGYLWTVHGIKLSEAERMIAKAMELSGGKDAYILDSMGWLKFRQGKYEEAEKVLLTAQDTKPGDVEIALHLAEVLFVNGKTKQAESVVRSVLEGEPKNEQALELLRKNNIRP